MAIYRQLQTTFWSDSFVTELTPEQKYFYIYLLTNEKTKQCGIYEITLRAIAFDTGYNVETVEKLLLFFQASGKIKWSKETNEIALKNWSKYNNHKSNLVQICIKKELMQVKNTLLIPYLYPLHTLSKEEQEQEQTEEQTNNNIISDIESKKEVDENPKSNYNTEVDMIYNLYPTECYVKGTPTGKGTKNKEKIRSIIKQNGYEWLRLRVESYLVSCKQNKVYLKNFTTFLNNIPEPIEVKPQHKPYIPNFQSYEDLK